MSTLIKQYGSLLILVVYITLAASEPIFPIGRLHGFSDYKFQQPIFPKGSLRGYEYGPIAPPKIIKVFKISLATQAPLKTTTTTQAPLKTTTKMVNCTNLCTRNPLYNPHCGTDNKTYPDPCILLQLECVTLGKIKLQRRGQCGGATEFDLSSKEFPLLSNEEKEQCMNLCTRNPIYHPHCGTDYKTYPDPCILIQVQCLTRGNIKMRQFGKCGGTRYSSLTEKTDPLALVRRMRCMNRCIGDQIYGIYSPHCGTDGKTYSNPCILYQLDCITQGKIKMKHPGKCSGETEHYLVPEGEPITEKERKICMDLCTENPTIDPHCGSDRITYPNPCILNQIKCLTRGRITLKHPGKCKEPLALVPITMAFLESTYKYMKFCIRIPSYEPECGSDGKTYYSHCMFSQFRNVLKQYQLNYKHAGECEAK